LAAQGRDIKLSTSRIEGYRNFATKLWNAARFAEMNGCALDPKFDPAKARLTVNRWIVSSLAQTASRVTEAIEAFEFNAAADALYHFTWGTFCDWYVELSKPVLTGNDADAKLETRAVTSWVLSQIVHLLHPVMPFITEELWKHLAGGKAGMLMTSHWPKFEAGLIDHDAAAEMDWVVGLIAQIRTARSEMNVPPGNEIFAYLTEAGTEQKEWIARHADPIKRLARLKQIHPADAAAPAKQNSIQVVVEKASLLLDLAGAVDLGKERARLAKEASSLRGELDKIAAKLGNEQFISKAKPEAVEEQREREANARAALARLDAALERIGGA
jgi:valyl-tRNA synthetase